MFAFLSSVSAILLAGLVTALVIVACWGTRFIFPDTNLTKTRRRKFIGDETPDHRVVTRTRQIQPHSPFDVLGLTAVPSSFAEIRAAFLRESNRTHPDKNPNDLTAADRFDRVRKAYEQVGTPELLRDYLKRNPVEEIVFTFNVGDGKILTFQEFANDFATLRSKWKRSEATRIAELERRLLGQKRPPSWKKRWQTYFGRFDSRPEATLIEDVVFDRSVSPKAEYFRVFNCYLRVDKKETFYQVLRFILAKNGFKDTFSDVKGNSNCVTIIGDLPGFIFPKTIKTLISHDDHPRKLFTRLWDLGLYRGPKVKEID